MSIGVTIVAAASLNALLLRPVKTFGRRPGAFLIGSRMGCVVGILLALIGALLWVGLVRYMERDVEIVWWVLFATCSVLAGWAGMPHDGLSPCVYLLLPDLQAVAICLAAIFFAGQMQLSLCNDAGPTSSTVDSTGSSGRGFASGPEQAGSCLFRAQRDHHRARGLPGSRQLVGR